MHSKILFSKTEFLIQRLYDTGATWAAVFSWPFHQFFTIPLEMWQEYSRHRRRQLQTFANTTLLQWASQTKCNPTRTHSVNFSTCFRRHFKRKIIWLHKSMTSVWYCFDMEALTTKNRQEKANYQSKKAEGSDKNRDSHSKYQVSSWYHCLPIRTCLWLWEEGCTAVVWEAACCMEVRPGL